MRIPEQVGRRPLSEELAFVCLRLQADEADILGKALRRGVFEIYKAVVLHELQIGRLGPEEARRMLGSLVVARAGSEQRPPARGGSRKPGRARRRAARGRRP
ncbi:MAG TPA: hypothetical protein VGV60_04440 [Candidatus Polarisedimenticolia bacterium]|jgi:hypothetical protein|nr:hypothetical protein [Candidatus Polarisedimenticolia bacterium]